MAEEREREGEKEGKMTGKEKDGRDGRKYPLRNKCLVTALPVSRLVQCAGKKGQTKELERQ